jgi:hypothetical protein
MTVDDDLQITCPNKGEDMELDSTSLMEARKMSPGVDEEGEGLELYLFDC